MSVDAQGIYVSQSRSRMPSWELSDVRISIDWISRPAAAAAASMSRNESASTGPSSQARTGRKFDLPAPVKPEPAAAR